MITYWLGIIGILMLLLGIYIMNGGFKIVYIVQGRPFITPITMLRGGLIPYGLTFIVWSIVLSDLVPDITSRQKLTIWLVGPMTAISVGLAVWQPQWLQPRWLAYLENKYGDTSWYLLQEAAKDPQAWAQRVKTQAGLEEWAEETLSSS
jgi:hypothetical protein